MRLLALLVLLSLLPPFLAAGQDIAEPDFEQAREAVERGRILPLAEVLARLHESQPGRVIEVDLDEEDGMMIYEVELATPDGRLIEVEIDAASGRILALDEDDEDED
ncbi:PepSY domain-containing protein [Paracoccus versutus]